jgi:hypothetical protein
MSFFRRFSDIGSGQGPFFRIFKTLIAIKVRFPGISAIGHDQCPFFLIFQTLVSVNVSFQGISDIGHDQCPFFLIFQTLVSGNVSFQGISDIGHDQCPGKSKNGHCYRSMSEISKVLDIGRHQCFLFSNTRTLTAINVAHFLFPDIVRVQRLFLVNRTDLSYKINRPPIPMVKCAENAR